MRISEFQEMMKRLYFHRDSERGIKGTYNWLVDEVKELGEVVGKNEKKLLKKSLQTSLRGLRLLLT